MPTKDRDKINLRAGNGRRDRRKISLVERQRPVEFAQPLRLGLQDCLNYRLTYDAAEVIFKNFLTACENLDDNRDKSLTNDFTRLVKSETAAFSEQDIISVEDTKNLYPTVDRFIGKDILDNVNIEKNSDGTQKILSHLTTAMLDAQKIELPVYADCPLTAD